MFHPCGGDALKSKIKILPRTVEPKMARRLFVVDRKRPANTSRKATARRGKCSDAPTGFTACRLGNRRYGRFGNATPKGTLRWQRFGRSRRFHGPQVWQPTPAETAVWAFNARTFRQILPPHCYLIAVNALAGAGSAPTDGANNTHCTGRHRSLARKHRD